MDAARAWRDQLAAWALPEGFAERAPDRDPWRLEPADFVDRALARRHPEVGGDDHDETDAERVAREALGDDGGVVLDVGCGAGAATVGLGRRATLGIGVDEQPAMLAAYARVLARCGIAHREVRGRWPDVAPRTPRADVVVAHNVVYNVPDLDAFLLAADDHARRRVVLELTVEHPRAAYRPYWRAMHGVDRPDGPTVDDLLAVCDQLGLDVEVATSWRPSAHRDDPDRRRERLVQQLCLRDDERERLAEVDRRIGGVDGRDVATVWW